MNVLYFCAHSEGGLADYASYQSHALAQSKRLRVYWLGPLGLNPPIGVFPLDSLRIPARNHSRYKLLRGLRFALNTIRAYYALKKQIAVYKPDVVILSSWNEYFSPLWSPWFRHLRSSGIRFCAVIHDPVRSYVVGPNWWHRLSIRQAFSFLDIVFTHDSRPLNLCDGSASFDRVQIPHGPYNVPVGCLDRFQLRRDFIIDPEAVVLLSFGHIRDGKNLDQIIKSLAYLSNVHLIIAGTLQSASQKNLSFYRNLAQSLGVHGRCHWYAKYIDNSDIWKFFRVSDILMLTYSSDFFSASGVLNINTGFQLPVIASAAEGPLVDAVQNYNLGVILESPDAGSIANAVPRALQIEGEWQRFANDNSWKTNAERMLEALTCRF